jgi:hypothetical protein
MLCHSGINKPRHILLSVHGRQLWHKTWSGIYHVQSWWFQHSYMLWIGPQEKWYPRWGLLAEVPLAWWWHQDHLVAQMLSHKRAWRGTHRHGDTRWTDLSVQHIDSFWHHGLQEDILRHHQVRDKRSAQWTDLCCRLPWGSWELQSDACSSCPQFMTFPYLMTEWWQGS